MGGGIRDRMILVDAGSLAPDGQKFMVHTAIRDNFGKIRSLRESLENNEGVQQVLLKAGYTLNDLVAVDARGGGVVILYFTD